MNTSKTQITSNRARTRRDRRVRGFTLFEVTLSLIILAMMTMMFAACFPLIIKSATFSNNYSQASFLAQHKIDQLRAAGFSRLDSTDLGNLGIVDATPTTSPYSFTTADGLTSFFPVGSTGTVAINPDTATCPAGASSCTLANATVADVTVTITWTGGGMATGSYSAYAKIITMNHR